MKKMTSFKVFIEFYNRGLITVSSASVRVAEDER